MKNLLQGLITVCLLTGCPGPVEQFIGDRVEDSCNQDWNVCDGVTGCLLGDQSYISGRLPSDQSVGLQIFEPSTVTLTFLLSDVASAGTTTHLYFWETACSSKVALDLDGKTFVGESDKTGVFTRSADLSGVGDHLIQFNSDTRASYLFKVDIVPVRLKTDSQGP